MFWPLPRCDYTEKDMFVDIERHDDWTPADYFACDAVSNSLLARMVKDPATTFDKIEPNDAMKLGSAADEFILTPERFEKNYTVVRDVAAPSGKNQSDFCSAIIAGKTPEEAMDAAYKKPPMPADEMYEMFRGWIELQTNPYALSEASQRTLNRLKENVMSHMAAAEIVRHGAKQVCYTGTHESTGVRVKGMIDVLWDDMEVDLKTTSSKWEQVNRFWLRDRSYHTQRAMYTQLSGATSTAIIVVQTTGRHRCRVFDLTANLMEENWVGILDQRIREYAWRKENGYWDHAVQYYTNRGYETL